MLGTFITEWKEGARYCSSILDNVESYQHFAKQLVDIACYYNFDGWLINIENEIIVSVDFIFLSSRVDKICALFANWFKQVVSLREYKKLIFPLQPSQVESLVDFLRFLTTSMHSAKPDSQVI